jgi:hypothetical protein
MNILANIYFSDENMDDTSIANQSKEKTHGSQVCITAAGKLVQIFRSSWEPNVSHRVRTGPPLEQIRNQLS